MEGVVDPKVIIACETSGLKKGGNNDFMIRTLSGHKTLDSTLHEKRKIGDNRFLEKPVVSSDVPLMQDSIPNGPGT